MDAPAPPRPPESPPGPHRRRRLHRDREHGILGGVCAGIAETYDIDVALVRILWVIAGIVWIGIPAYIVAWIALPGRGEPGFLDDHPRDIGLIAGLALVGIGAFIAVHQLVPHWWHGGELLAALLLIGGGIAILVMRRPVTEGDHRPDTSPQTEVPADEPATDTEPTIEAWVAPAQAAGGSASDPPVPPTAWTQRAPWPAPESRRRTVRAERRAARPRAFLTPLTISILLIGAGITSLLQATGAIDVNLTVALAIATAFVGVALVVSTWFGRARALILVGILLTGATTVASALDVPLHGGVGNRSYHPVQLAQVQHPYELAVGQLVIDFRDLSVPAAGTTTVQAQLGIGELEVDVPNSVAVVADAHAGAGSLRLFGHETGGWDVTDTRTTAGTGAGGTLQLQLKVGAGQVRVRRFAGDVELIGGSNP